MEAIFLAEEEVQSIRPLWEEVFAEDSKEFTDYYFKNKAEQNLVFAREDNGQIVSMLHLTPYLTGNLEPVCYIVGVATKEEYRRQGLMRSVMEEALQFMWEEGQPFTFLMPANPAYYTPFDFVYVYAKPQWKLNETYLPAKFLDAAAENESSFHLLMKGNGQLEICTVKEPDLQEISDFANACLRIQSDCFMLRNPHYYKMMKRELIAQKGNLFMIKKDGCLKGLLSYHVENEKPVLQEVIFTEGAEEDNLCPVAEARPAIMGRILRTEVFLEGMESCGKLDLILAVRDSIIKENSGMYRLHCQSGGGTVSCKKMHTEKEADCEVTVEALTAFCFGQREAEKCFVFFREEEAEEMLQQLSLIKVRRHPFINEIV